jgi:hypothetical protein
LTYIPTEISPEISPFFLIQIGVKTALHRKVRKDALESLGQYFPMTFLTAISMSSVLIVFLPAYIA